MNNTNKSEQINELATALAKAQSVIENATKSAKNPFFRSKYADLPAVWAACREPLTSNGLSVTQIMDTSENGQILESILLHSSGQWISSLYPVKPMPDKEGHITPQGLGSALSYARRYSLMALIGIAAEGEDDDGEKAMGRGEKEGFISEMMSAPTAAEANLTRLGYLKKEGMEAAEGGMGVLGIWWKRQLASDQKNLLKYKDETLKPIAEEADKVNA